MSSTTSYPGGPGPRLAFMGAAPLFVVAVAKDGALLVTDDGSNTVWRVSCQK